MRKFNVFINGDTTEVNLDEAIVVSSSSSLHLKNVTVFWEYKNVKRSPLYDTGTPKELEPGYWTYALIKRRLGEDNVSLKLSEHDYFTKIVNNGPNTFQVVDNRFLQMLGFDGINLQAGGTQTANRTLDINLGLRYVKIKCDLADTSRNFDNGKRSDVIKSIPITSQQTLFGSVQNFFDIKSKVHINKGVINQLKFSVTDQDNNPVNVGDTYS